jgi:dihydrofolate synthase/folylpolyglutamate synthase
MIASILQSSGYKTGLYTSPHLKEFTERIKINGEEVDREYVVDFVHRIQPHIEIIKPSFFEITVVMAFDYFVQQGVDIAVIEVGMGGRLDSTKVIDPELSVITNIGLDHKDLLGDTLEKIALEKAGIIKSKKPVVVSESQPEILNMFQSRCDGLGSPLVLAWEEYNCNISENGFAAIRNGQIVFSDLDIPLRGDYQVRNIPAVLSACDILRHRGFTISPQHIVDGLLKVIGQTGLKGRWQKLDVTPTIYCDTGHNPEGISIVMNQIANQKFDKLWIVFGVVKDKSPDDVLALLP